MMIVNPLPTAPAVDAAALIDRARRGDVDAFELLYHAHAAHVHALCLRLAGDAGHARELTQDVFIRAWNALPEFRGDAELATWLHRIAVNALLMQRRAEGRREAHLMLVPDDELCSGASAGHAAATDDVGARIDLERAIADLPAGVRRAFVLHDIEGYSHEEIALMTGRAAGTLRAQLHRARQLLIKALGS